MKSVSVKCFVRYPLLFYFCVLDPRGWDELPCAQLNWSWEVPCQYGHWHQVWTFQRNGLSHYSYPTPMKEQQDHYLSLHSSHHCHVCVFMHIYFESVSLQVADPHLVPWTLLRCSHHSLKKKTQDVSLHSSHHCQVCVFMHVSVLWVCFSLRLSSHMLLNIYHCHCTLQLLGHTAILPFVHSVKYCRDILGLPLPFLAYTGIIITIFKNTWNYCCIFPLEYGYSFVAYYSLTVGNILITAYSISCRRIKLLQLDLT